MKDNLDYSGMFNLIMAALKRELFLVAGRKKDGKMQSKGFVAEGKVRETPTLTIVHVLLLALR